ncbi:hypothetical protein HYPSUDRAFT_65223 [Hypholoma sublateritium FD-334 SS-4]|uniref:Uncharacterized protein n=1 Tax=Hypholoma sublateritium (strain FD-334 SS-4) TaxID=945553 RepID=A0A0D2P1U3_HYPSF|nr:hypothetical protein HYPSUDRAFT_65223 [Hypholoma sublateritium FD-334 SS-4]
MPALLFSYRILGFFELVPARDCRFAIFSVHVDVFLLDVDFNITPFFVSISEPTIVSASKNARVIYCLLRSGYHFSFTLGVARNISRKHQRGMSLKYSWLMWSLINCRGRHDPRRSSDRDSRSVVPSPHIRII